MHLVCVFLIVTLDPILILTLTNYNECQNNFNKTAQIHKIHPSISFFTDISIGFQSLVYSTTEGPSANATVCAQIDEGTLERNVSFLLSTMNLTATGNAEENIITVQTGFYPGGGGGGGGGVASVPGSTFLAKPPPSLCYLK